MLYSVILALGIFVVGFLAILFTYFFCLFIGILIPVNRRFRTVDNGVDFYISTNGLHTSFVVPIKNQCFDWTQWIDPRCFDLSFDEKVHLSIGLGDKAIYLDMPEWSQLTFKLGAKTLFWPTPTLLRVTAYDGLPTGKLCKTKISE